MAKINFKEVVKKVTEAESDILDTFDDRYPVSIPEVKSLRGEKGLSYREIGLILGVTKQAIHYICKVHNIKKAGIKKYREVRLSNLLHLEENLFDLTRAEINSIKPGNRIVNGAIIFDKVQLESLKPTQVVAYLDMVQAFKELEKQSAQEKAKLGQDVIDAEVVEDDLLNAT